MSCLHCFIKYYDVCLFDNCYIIAEGDKYGKCSKFSNSLHTNKIMVVRAGYNKILVRIANREDPDQAASYALFV